MRRLIQWLKCRLWPLGTGHILVPTGKTGYLLAEYRCDECGKLLIGHAHHPRVYLPADHEVQIYMKDIGPFN